METDLDLATKDKEDFTALFEEDSDDNLELWRALVGSEATVLPKKGDLVVYFPQGHLEYAASITYSLSIEVPTLDLKPEIICRVQHVQLIANKRNDEICAHVTLLPEPEANKENDENDEGCTQVTLLPEQKLVGQNPKGKEVIESGVNEAKNRRKRTKSASRVFSKTLSYLTPNSDDLQALVLPVAAYEILFPSHFEAFGSHREVVVHDFQGTEWTFSIIYTDMLQNFWLSKGWEEFVHRKMLFYKDTVSFVRCQDGSLRLGMKKHFDLKDGLPLSIVRKHYGRRSNMLSPVADAILNKSMFHIFYCPRVGPAGFVVPYQKYMESITRRWMIGTEFKVDGCPRPWMIGTTFKIDCSFRRAMIRTEFETDDFRLRHSGVVTGISELDPFKWPGSKWKCLMVRWDGDKAPQTQVVSPWEILCTVTPSTLMTDFSPKLKKPRISQQDSSPTNFDPEMILKEREKEANVMIQEEFQLSEFAEQESIEDIETDRQSSSASFIKKKSTTIMPTHFKISKRSDQEIPLDPMIHNSLQYLEFDSCLFHSPPRLRYFPIGLKSFKITNCINSEHILSLLMAEEGLSLESLEVDGSDSLVSLPIDKLPVTLRQLKILNCMNLESLVTSLDTGKQVTLSRILELRELVISDCRGLEFLPEGLHNLIHFELLSISNCASLVSFPEGGLPKNCLTTLKIHGCENLMSLPSQLHEFTSLKNLSVFGCPCLTSFPEADLPPNLVSLEINGCENLIHLSRWRLHKLKHLRRYKLTG